VLPAEDRTSAVEESCDVVVVGAGFAGLYAVHRAGRDGLLAVGIEAGDDVGGTWYWNRYPGARCDVESVDYSFSFDEELQNGWRWSERFATQPEIRAYASHMAERFGLRDRYRFGERVTSARFDESTSTWLVETGAGTRLRAPFVVFATGSLSVPHRPSFPGVDDFGGEVYFTAQWPESPVDLTGRRVGVIGTGSSGIQVVTAIAPVAAGLTVFQRTANYSIPTVNGPLTDAELASIRATYPARRAITRRGLNGSGRDAYEKSVFEVGEEERRAVFERGWTLGGVAFAKTFPDQMVDDAVNRVARDFVHSKIREIVHDPATADDLTPTDHPIGAKRICSDSGYYETFNRDDVTLVNLRTDPIVRVVAGGIETASGLHQLDVIVYATGFDALTGALLRIDVRGRGGIRLADVWDDGPLTYLGVSVPGFPNLFLVNGPGGPSVLGNMILGAELQVDWVADLVAHAGSRGAQELEARADAAATWTEHVDEVAAATLYAKARSWYMGANIEGKKQRFMPYAGGLGSYTDLCARVRDDGYEGFALTSRSPEATS
jgi:cation diffusion facilitator CzcD-associated flavoprotein CzcO